MRPAEFERHEDEINRLANDLAGEWRERAEKAEAEITVWKTRLVEETARLRNINRGAVSALREIAHMEPDPNEGVRPLDDLIDRMKGEAERALDRLNPPRRGQ